MLWSHPSLFEPAKLAPWQPRVLSKGNWSERDYAGVFAWRMQMLAELESDPISLAAAKAYYKRNPADFILHWMDTYDPRKKGLKWLPFVLFERQREFIDFLHGCNVDDENGLVEKCRDMGATWLCCAYSIHQWIFVKDTSIGWGSRKQELVDRLGDFDSIFEKLRQQVERIPPVFRPNYQAAFMKLINVDNGAIITGESGDNIGRGGRKKIYFKDESAHYERPELIEAALGDNTNCQIDISSVNGLGNVFYRRRKAGIDWPAIESGKTRVFVFRYNDHPEKTVEWYEKRRQKYEDEGMLHIFAQEVERNYSAAVENTIIPRIWIDAARDAHLKIDGMLDGPVRGGFDVADEGLDRNAIAEIKGVVWRKSIEWGDRDPGNAARRCIGHFAEYGKDTEVNYDNIGVGAAVKSEINRLGDDQIVIPRFIGWNAGSGVQRPFERVIPDDEESAFNKDFFKNLKAQGWWSLRTRFLRTYQRIVQGVQHPPETCISLSNRNPLIEKLCDELAQPVMTRDTALRMVIDKKPDGTPSPNLADAGMMGYFPIEDLSIIPLVGRQANG